MRNEPNGACRIASAIPGRIRVQLTGPRATSDLAREVAAHVEGLRAVQEVCVLPEARSVLVRYAAAERPVPEMVGAVQRAVGRVTAASAAWRAPATRRARRNGHASGGGADQTRPEAGPAEDRSSERGNPLVAPTLALALAWLEAPLLLSGLALGVAIAPSMAKATKAAREHRIRMSLLDAVTMTTLAAMGDVRAAAEIAWVLGLADFAHSTGLRRARRQLAEDLPVPAMPEYEKKQLAAMLAHAPIGQSQTEKTVRGAADRISGPLLGIAGVMLAITRDPLRVVNLLKFADIDSGVRVTAPEAVLSALVQAARHAVFIRGGQELEALAGVNAIVVEAAPRTSARSAATVARALVERRIGTIAFPAGKLADAARIAAAEVGRGEAVVAVPRGGALDLVRRLRAEGLNVAVVDGSVELSEAGEAANLRVGLKDAPGLDRSRAEVVLLDGGIDRLPDAIDLARKAMRVLKQNVGVVVGPSAAGFGVALAGMTPPIFTTLVTNGAALLAGLNALRSLGSGREKNASQPLPTAAPAGAG